jgi:hypothetical protein
LSIVAAKYQLLKMQEILLWMLLMLSYKYF